MYSSFFRITCMSPNIDDIYNNNNINIKDDDGDYNM